MMTCLFRDTTRYFQAEYYDKQVNYTYLMCLNKENEITLSRVMVG